MYTPFTNSKMIGVIDSLATHELSSTSIEAAMSLTKNYTKLENFRILLLHPVDYRTGGET